MKNDHPKINFGKTGILLINLGTPDSTSWWDIRKYLKEFLSDRRVIELNPVIWQLILNLFILTFRPSKPSQNLLKLFPKLHQNHFFLQFVPIIFSFLFCINFFLISNPSKP